MNKKLNVAVLCGGSSSEREVSLKSGENVAEAVRNLGYEVRVYDPATDLVKIIQDKEWIDVVFPALHGQYGEDGTIQGFLELLGLKYVGSGVLASALTMDKMRSRETYKLAGLPVADAFEIKDEEDLELIENRIGFPCVIKPIANGSSIGVEIVDNMDASILAYSKVKELGGAIMAEQYIKGRELTVGVIGNGELKALPIIEIVTKNRFFDYEAKYSGESKEYVPDDLSKDVVSQAQDFAIRAHRALGCRGMSRTDLIFGEKGLILLETNTIPGMTKESLLPKAEKADGFGFERLIDEVLKLALEEKDGVS